MLDRDIYAIYTDDNEYGGTVKELYQSFDEAKNDRFKYSNWFRDNGDVWIRLYSANGGFKCSHSWHILPNGRVVSEYPF